VQIGGQNARYRQSAAVVAMGMLSKMRVLLEKQAPEVLAFVAGLIVLAALSLLVQHTIKCMH
jgi:hypothetical protein